MTPGTISAKSSPAVALGRDAAEIHKALTELVRVYQFRDRQRVCYFDISVTQCYALKAIIRLETSRVDDVARELYLEKSTASRVVDSLVQKGYVDRNPDPNDRRAVRVRATRKGRALHRRIEDDLVDQTKSLIESYGPEVRRAAGRLIAEMADAARRRFCGQNPDDRKPGVGND